MTPKERAVELFYKIYFRFDINIYEAKQRSLIAIDEILSKPSHIETDKYWEEVKNEIEKL